MALWLACTQPATDTDTALYVVDIDESDPPTFEAGALEAVLADLLARLDTLNSDVVFAAYDEAMTHADETCPAPSTAEGNIFWEGECVTEKGADFNGYVSTLATDDEVISRTLSGEAKVILPGGEMMVVAGTIIQERKEDGSDTWTSAVTGVFAYDGPAAAGTWLAEDLDVNLEWEMVYDGALSSITVDGSVADATSAVTAIDLDDFTYELDDAWPCAEEPSGVVAFRDEAGLWVELEFDVAKDGDGWTIDAEQCDGCADVWYRGDVIETVCVDTAVLARLDVPQW